MRAGVAVRACCQVTQRESSLSSGAKLPRAPAQRAARLALRRLLLLPPLHALQVEGVAARAPHRRGVVPGKAAVGRAAVVGAAADAAHVALARPRAPRPRRDAVPALDAHGERRRRRGGCCCCWCFCCCGSCQGGRARRCCCWCLSLWGWCRLGHGGCSRVRTTEPDRCREREGRGGKSASLVVSRARRSRGARARGVRSAPSLT